jgi:hypothetical protein
MKKHKTTKVKLAAWALLAALFCSSSAEAGTLAAAQRQFAAVQHQYGFGSPETAVGLTRLAEANEERGSHQRAVTLYRRSGAVVQNIAGPEEPFLLYIFNGLASTYEAMKKYAAADAVYDEVRFRGYPVWAEQMEFRADVMRQAESLPARLAQAIESKN